MSRAYTFYVLMFGALIGGLWLVLTLGAAVKAPDDLSGRWIVDWDAAPAAGENANVMTIAQSGRYFNVRFGQQKPIPLTLAEGWQGARHGRTLVMQMQGTEWKMDVTGDIPLRRPGQVPEVKVTLTGRSNHAGVARRDLPPSAAASAASGASNSRPAETVHAR